MKSNARVKFITLGCKVNQYETQGMREIMERAGVREENTPGTSARPCDFVVINTCTVTREADKENHYWIRRARRENPQARIVVTGCYVEKNRASLESLPEVDLILSNAEKHHLAERLMTGCGSPAVQTARHQYAPLSISRSAGRARAFVKIQDGCNHGCSFCKVVLVRGRSRSRELTDIIDEVKRLRDSGYHEIVLAGIQLGAYGLDLEKENGLVDVLEACARIDGIERLRLSSIEPMDVRDPLIRTLRGLSKCCHHLHIPLQCGDDEILRRMNRRYTRSYYLDLIAHLREELTDFSLTLDVMAGFPGEEERHFQNTVDLLETVRPLKCHVFPYSRREGTRAAHFVDCPDKVIRERVRCLIAQGDRLGAEERKRYEGRVFPVLVEKKTRGLVQGMTANYLKVCFQAEENAVGNIFPVELLTLQGDLFLGRIRNKEGGH